MIRQSALISCIQNELVETYGTIKGLGEGRYCSGASNAAGWLLPDGRHPYRRYPEVLYSDTGFYGTCCGGLCASCQRMYDFQSEHLNFDFEALKPRSWDKASRQMRYLKMPS